MTYTPQSHDEAVEVVRSSLAKRRTLLISGGGTHRVLGREVAACSEFSTSGLNGITLYEPAELVMSARAGTPLRLIEEALRERGQVMAFEPPDHQSVLGTSGVLTIGGVFATNSSGPRRLVSGAARDHLLGVTLVNGRGDTIRAGGRVMKNVTGLDVTKLVCGAYGTLGLMTEVTFKVLPSAAFEATLRLPAPNPTQAIALMTKAMGSPFEVSGAAFDNGEVLLRIEGFVDSVRYRAAALASMLDGQSQALEAEESAVIWRDIKSLAALRASEAQEIWRLSVAPSKSAAVLALLPDDCRLLLDWSGGLAWIATSARLEDVIRPAAESARGHAMLYRASAERRAAVSPFHPLSDGVKRLTLGLKNSLDPDGIFNPGKMYEDI